MCACIYVHIFPSSTHREDLGAVHPNSMHILSTQIVVSKYPFSNKKQKQESLEKWLIPVLELSKYSMNLEHPAMPENKKVLKE